MKSFKDSLRDCQASICIIRIGKLPSIVIVMTGKDMGEVTITAGRPVKQQELYITDGEAGGWMAQSHKRHWVLWSQWSVFKHFIRLKNNHHHHLGIVFFAVIQWSLWAGQFSLCLTGPTIAGAWLLSAVFQVKAQFRGKTHQNRAGQEKFGICSFKGMHIHIKMQFLSEILK